MISCSHPTTEEIDPLLPAYRILLRIARERKAARRGAAESSPAGQEEGAGRTNPTPASDADLHQPDQRFAACPLQCISRNRPTRSAPMPSAVDETGVHFADRRSYQVWARIVDEEAPGLSAQLLTMYSVDGSCNVVFRLNDGHAPLTADGLDVLKDITRRLGIGVSDKRPSHKKRGSRPAQGNCPGRRGSFPLVSNRRSSPCQLPA
jgi:hypothetical protein